MIMIYNVDDYRSTYPFLLYSTILIYLDLYS